jgi:hypothetical protein
MREPKNLVVVLFLRTHAVSIDLETGYEAALHRKRRLLNGKRATEEIKCKTKPSTNKPEGKTETATDLPLFGIKQRQLWRLFFVTYAKIVFTVQSVRTKCFDAQPVLLDQLVVCIKGEVL